ncbi:MAG: septal ring lytic transglycosylase RlpA family protein [Betaproteobacteria bacterium]|nr:septal ring lytic transglycosylase RlpA family protein [Betaproteobacteria bacterium]
MLLSAVATAASPVRDRSGTRSPGLPADAIGGADILDPEVAGLHGQASFYGPGFHGRRTANGEIFDQRGFSAASNRFPLGTWVAVRRLDDERCVILRVNDRMHPAHRRRIIDVSRAAADTLGMVNAGVVLVRVVPLNGPRDPVACPTAEPPLTEPVPDLEAEWWRPAPPPSLDAAD